MRQIRMIKIITVLSLFASGLFAIDCPADTAYHMDLRTMLPDGSPNPSYGQIIATGLCACLDFVSDASVNANDSTVTFTIRIVDNEPIRGAEIDIYHYSDNLEYSGTGTVSKGEKLLNVTDPDGNPKTMTLLANQIDDHVKVMAYSTSQAQTEGNGEEGDLFMITYKAVNGLEALGSEITIGIGVCNLPGTSMAPDLLNVVCSFPDTLTPVIVTIPSVGIEDDLGIPTQYNLAQNFPNPFNPTTNIAFDIPEHGQVAITIFNLIGQQVRTLMNDQMVAGRYHVEWNGLDNAGNAVASGVYFYELRSENFIARKKMILLR